MTATAERDAPAGPASGQPAGPVLISGRILVPGGEGLISGGSGGDIEARFNRNPAVAPTAGQHIVLLGQRRLSVAGGDGHAGGGDGGIVIFNTASDGDDPIGPVVVEVPLDASGGDAGLEGFDLEGGRGGEVTFRGITIERGDVDVSAGTGTVVSSDGTVVEIFP